jgi:dienelactone hydrolase
VGSGDLPPLVSVPEQPAPWPGVVVLHDSRWHVGRPA